MSKVMKFSFKGFNVFYDFLVSIRKKLVKVDGSWSLGFVFFSGKGEVKAAVYFFN